MARPLCIELAGALSHVTSRGDRREAIFRDDQDRRDCLTRSGEVCTRFNWRSHAYCEMTNHYHFVVGSRPLDTRREIPRAQRRPLVQSLRYSEQTYAFRREAMARAFRTGVYALQEIANHFRVHYSTVTFSRAVHWLEANEREMRDFKPA